MVCDDLIGCNYDYHCFFYIVLIISRFHQVRSYQRNIAVNVWWKHVPNFVPRKCRETKTKDNPTLDKFHFSSLAANGDPYSEESEQGPEDLV